MVYPQSKSNWLPHHINVVPKRGYGNRLTMYLMTLEAWRRGLEVTFYLKENTDNRLLIRYKISDGQNTYKFNSSLGEKVTEEAFDICDNKNITKEYLKRAGINVPKGKLFTVSDTNEEVFSYAKNLGYPVVLKPKSANTGKGVHANIKNEDELKEAIYSVKALGFTNVIIEEKIEGTEYRILVLNGEVLAAVERVPANIVGDGKSTIKQLIQLKNKTKNTNPNLHNRLIQIDKEIYRKISELNYDLDTVVPNGEKVYLRDKVALDGDPISATEVLTKSEKDLSVKSVKSVPGLDLCGLDVIINRKSEKFTVIEMNTRPMLGLHIFPIKGESIDVISPILDHYFPETKDKVKSNLYYDFQSALAPIRDRSVKEVTLAPLDSLKPLYSKCLILEQFSYKEHLIPIITSCARRLQINGSIMELPNDEWEIIIGSKDKQKLNSFVTEIKKQIKDTEIKVLFESDWNYSINIGFKVNKISQAIKNNRALRKSSRKFKQNNVKLNRKNKLLQNKNKSLLRKNKKMKSELEKLQSGLQVMSEKVYSLEEILNDMLNSKSWRITKPLRSTIRIFNRNKR